VWGEDDKPGDYFGWHRSTLTEIEGEDWGEPRFQSGLVIRCHKLRKTPLRDFTLDDLRCLIGQGISLPVLMPLAVQALGEDPFAAGVSVPGSLLLTALHADRQFWLDHAELWQRMEAVVVTVEAFVSQFQPAAAGFRAVWHTP
jgi:hypothetical protein